jgi:hypothetical protein
LVTAIEVGEGKRFAEELIKTLTGGDTVTARFLYREFFEFRPRFKVWLAANYKPEIRGSDYAIWRRIRLIPFMVTIPPEEQIPDLAKQLKEELSGILNWALEGLRDWLANGLQPPLEVTEATEAYRAEMDIVGLFIQDACVTDPKAVTPSKTLYEAFQEWCSENGYEPFGQTAFGRRLAAKGFSHGRAYIEGRLRRCWFGIRLRSDTDPQPDLLPPDPSDSPDQPDMTDVTDVTRFSESRPINSDADQSFGKTRHNLSSVTNASDPSVTSKNPTIACHRDEQVVQYLPSPCCGEPIEPDEEGVGVCVGCGRRWQWTGASWRPADLPEGDAPTVEDREDKLSSRKGDPPDSSAPTPADPPPADPAFVDTDQWLAEWASDPPPADPDPLSEVTANGR